MDAPTPHVEHLLSGYLDHELRGQDAALVETHLPGCDACRAKLDQLQRLDQRLRRLRDTSTPAQLAPRVMQQLGVTRGEGGRVSSATTPVRTTDAAPSVPLRWATRIAFTVIVFAVIGVLGLFVLARIRQLPQAPLPEATLNTITFDSSSMTFYLNASSTQGIRDLTLTYWYDPRAKLTQSFHYDYPQADIELSYPIANDAARDWKAPARAVFYEWTLIEQSGRATTLPVRYEVFNSTRTAQPWRAITTTNTVLYFTGNNAEAVRNEYVPLVEQVYAEVTGNLALTQTNGTPLVFLINDVQNFNSVQGWAFTMSEGKNPAFMRVDLYAATSRRQMQATMARALTTMLVQDTIPLDLRTGSNVDPTSTVLLNGLPGTFAEQYQPSTVSDQLFVSDIVNSLLVEGQQPSNPASLVRRTYFQAPFMRYLYDTYGKAKITQLVQRFRQRNSVEVWNDVYGRTLVALFSEWWNDQGTRVTAARSQRSAQTPAFDILNNGLSEVTGFSDASASVTVLRDQLESDVPRLSWLSDSQRFALMALGTEPARMFIHEANSLRNIMTEFGLFHIYGTSADGEYVLFGRPLRTTTTLYIINTNTRRIITLSNGYYIRKAAWLPNGNIVFSGRQTEDDQQLYRIDAAQVSRMISSSVAITTGVQTQRFLPQDSVPGTAVLLASSRDGTRLAVLSQARLSTTLYLVEAGATPQARSVLDLGDTWIEHASFSPDGKRLVYQRQDGDRSTGIYVLNLENGTSTRIGGSPQADTYDLWPTWINDRWLVFSSTRSGGYDLYAARADGGKPLRISATRANYTNFLRPVASPDGTRLIFWNLSNFRLNMARVTLDMAQLESAAQ